MQILSIPTVNKIHLKYSEFLWAILIMKFLLISQVGTVPITDREFKVYCVLIIMEGLKIYRKCFVTVVKYELSRRQSTL